MELFLGLVILAAILALAYAAINFYSVKKLEEGSDRMKEIAKEIRVLMRSVAQRQNRKISVDIMDENE